MPSEKYTLAIDLGTSGPKIALVTMQGEVIDSEVEHTEILFLPNGGAEQRPSDWWNAIRTAVRRLLAKKNVNTDQIAAICASTQWSGTVALDKNGEALMNAIIWMDSRGAPQVKEMVKGPVMVEGYAVQKILKWLRLTGGGPGHSGKDSIAHILYIKSVFPEIYKKTYKFLEPKDYINFLLTGKMAASFDSITLHWLTDNRDIANIRYDAGLIKMAGVEAEKFPELFRAIDILGPVLPEVADDLGLPRGIPVIMGTPDVQAAAVGSGAVRDYEGHLCIGTSSWLTCHVPYKKTDIAHNIASLPSAIPNRYFVANEQETAGYCLTYLRDTILFPKDALTPDGPPKNAYEIFNDMAASIPAGSGKLIFTPWLYGERTPIEDHFVRGAFYNMSLSTTRAHMIRSVFEGVAYNSRWLLYYVEKFIKRKMESINMIGGGARSPLWCQIHADVLNRTIKQVKDPLHANARGAGYLASVALGHMTFDQIPSVIKIEKIFHPNPDNRKIYDELFKEFINLYKINKKSYARLNSYAAS